MKKYFILFIFSVCVSLGLAQDDDCIVSAGFELTPPPTDDPENTGFATYPTETTVQICYTVEEYNTPGTQNWMHGIVPSFGPGWDITTLQPVGQPEAQTNFGEWIWVDGGVTAGITGEFIPLAGWWYDSTQGTVPAGTPLDGDPSNNWGDGNNGPWEFCWEITTQSSPPQLDGASLIVEILNFADSETGSWDNQAALVQCIDDPSFYIQGLVLDAPTCDESEITVINPTCQNINTTGGVAIINPVGVGPWDYIWFDLESGEIIQTNNNVDFPGVVTVSGLDPGDYLIQVQDLGFAGGCASGEGFQILPPEEISVDFDIDSATCLDSADGSVIISHIMNENCIDESVIPDVIDFSLCPSAFVPVCGCDFTTYNNACYATDFFGITSYEEGECPDTNSDYDISWSSSNAINGSETEITDLAAGEYTVLIECVDNTSPVFGCSFESTIIVPSPEPFNITGTYENNYNGYEVSCNGFSDCSLNINVDGGNGLNTYQWTGPNGFVSNSQNLSDVTAGNYEVTVTDQFGCVSETVEFTPSQPQALAASVFNSDFNGFDISCNGGSDGSITLEVTGGVEPYTYQWSNGSSDPNLTNAPAGNYSVTVTCANSCQLVLNNLILTEPAPIQITNSTVESVLCFNSADGAIGITIDGGTGAYDFEWSNGDDTEDLINISSGSYTVDVIDENGCVYQETFNVPTPNPIVISETINNVSCLGDNDGVINVNVSGGTPFVSGADDYNYIWSNAATSQNLNGLSPGFYELTVTDSEGCSETETYLIDEPSLLVIDEVDVIDVDCFGDDTGSITPSVEGGTAPYTYLWSNGDNNDVLENVESGTYDLTVEDFNGCIDVFTGINISQPPSQLSVSDFVVTDVTCYNDSDGSIELIIAGGTPPYTTGNLSNFSAGSYTITIEDANGCQEDVNFDIDEPDELVANLEFTSDLCYGLSNGNANVYNAEGGTEPYTYLWSNGETGQDIEDLAPGNYYVSIEDALGCQVYEPFEILELASSDIEIVSSGSITCLEEFTVSAISSSAISGEWFANDNNLVVFDDSEANTTDVQVLDYGEYEIWFKDDDCGEEVYFNFEMQTVQPSIIADPYIQYCENEVTLLEAESDVNYGVWTLVSPSPDELDANNTAVTIDNETSLNTFVEIVALNDSEECCYGEYIFSFESCGAVDYETLYFSKRAPNIGLATFENCVKDGQIYIDNPISFSDALLNPGNWQAIGDNANDLTILYETPHEVGVNVSEYGMYTLEYENCDTTFRQNIGFSCPLTLPNVFTPNGDGNNDVFLSDQLLDDIHDQVNFTVYNRFGTIVHAQSDWSPVNGGALWDGTTNTFQDKKLGDGVYFYTLELFNRASNRKEMYNGYVHVFGGDN